jgi:hypothetical protein
MSPSRARSAVGCSYDEPVFLWFVALGFLAVVIVFQSPALDYRAVIIGSVLPLVDLIPGVPPVLHTLLAPVIVMTAVMLATRNRRLARRRALGVPIGMLMHLVLDGTWSTTELFWWPVFGTDLPDVPLPTLGRGAVGAVMELIGLAVLVWSWKRFGLDDPARRETFLREGRLDRDLVR